MAERCNVSGDDQGESYDSGIDWAAFGKLRGRCDDVSEPWLTDADIYDEKGAPAAFDEQSMRAHEVCETGVYHLAGGWVVTDADLEADAAHFEDGEWKVLWGVRLSSVKTLCRWAHVCPSPWLGTQRGSGGAGPNA